MSDPKGIDYYYNDGTPSLAGDDFVVIKASEGATFPPDGSIPQWYTEEQNRIRSTGAVFGAFLFYHPGTDNSAQLANFVKRANLRDGDIIQLDCETTDGLGWSTINAQKNDMLAKLKARYPRNRVLLYTYIDFWNHIDSTVGDGLWIADPSAPAGQPRINTPWVMHQYATNNVDFDVANFPSAEAFRTWASFGDNQTGEPVMIIHYLADGNVWALAEGAYWNVTSPDELSQYQNGIVPKPLEAHVSDEEHTRVLAAFTRTTVTIDATTAAEIGTAIAAALQGKLTIPALTVNLTGTASPAA